MPEVSADRDRRIGVAGLMQRLLARACADDAAEVIRHWLDVSAETTSPLIDYYRDPGILAEVVGDQPSESITADIQARLDACWHNPAGRQDGR